jgi:VWFA-related protein
VSAGCRLGTAAIVLAAVAAAPLAQSPTFRASTVTVPVYVSVRNGSSIIGGLGSADFALTDRGVPQKLEVVSSDAVPVDVTLVVDTSSSVINSLPQFRADVLTIVAGLQRDEQIRLITFDTDVRQILPMQSPAERPPVDRIQLGQTTSLADAVVLALARARRPERRHLVFVFTDGYDTSSMLGYGALADLASRTDSLVHIALVRPSSTEAPTPAAIAALAEAAARTGGALYPPSQNVGGLVAAFDRAIADFRHSYVLHFTPTDAESPGWHEIAVRVLKPGNHEVRARAGYFGRQ